MNVAFTMIGGKDWMGGYNYLVNLCTVLNRCTSGRVTPFLFVGEDQDDDLLRPFKAMGISVIVHRHFNVNRKNIRLLSSICFFCDRVAARIFNAYKIDIVFENAVFYGSRFPLPVMGWIPDFQHRRLKALFSFARFWKRELGFLAQVYSGRTIMVSSKDAQKDCESYYPKARSKIMVVPFAVNMDPCQSYPSKMTLIKKYGLPDQFYCLPNQFYKHKNHMVVIKGMRSLKDVGKSVHIVLSGQPAHHHHPGWFESLMAAIETEGVSDCFTYVGRIPFPDLLGLMLASKAVINPSFFEGWSTSVEEAKSLGIPLLLSDICVHREQAGEGAVFFDPSSPKAFAQAIDSIQKGRHPLENGVQFERAENRLKNFARAFETSANATCKIFHTQKHI